MTTSTSARTFLSERVWPVVRVVLLQLLLMINILGNLAAWVVFIIVVDKLRWLQIDYRGKTIDEVSVDGQILALGVVFLVNLLRCRHVQGSVAFTLKSACQVQRDLVQARIHLVIGVVAVGPGQALVGPLRKLVNNGLQQDDADRNRPWELGDGRSPLGQDGLAGWRQVRHAKEIDLRLFGQASQSVIHCRSFVLRRAPTACRRFAPIGGQAQSPCG